MGLRDDLCEWRGNLCVAAGSEQCTIVLVVGAHSGVFPPCLPVMPKEQDK